MPSRAQRFYSPAQVAELMGGCHPKTVRRMCLRGTLESVKRPGSCRHMIPERAVVKLQKSMVPVVPAGKGE